MVVVVGLVANFVMKRKGNVEVPGISIINEGKDEYVVKKGDYLWKIAVLEYGDGFQWVKIWQENKGMIKNPDLIYPGMKLVIPVMVK